MNTKALAYVCATAVMIAGGGAGTSQVTSRNRILRPVDAAQLAPVRGTAHPMARAQFDRGRTDTTKILSASLTFRLSPAQQADMDLLLRQQQDRTSPNFRSWLTPEQYAARFGMTSADLAKVMSWLQSQGLTVDGISRSRNEINFSGSVGQVEYALKTELHDYSINGEQHFANATDLAFPAAFSSQVLGVRGLDDFHPKPRIRPAPRFTSNVSGNHFLIPGDFATIYNVPSNLDGSGVTIAVIGQTIVNHTDLAAFRTAAGLPAATSSNFVTTNVPGTGTIPTCTGDETEADLDLEWSEGVAKNATINYVVAGLGTGTTCNNRTKNVFDALKYAIDNNIGRVISISYGNCEANLGASFVLTMQQWAQKANAQGQTISGPAGDQGAADCESATATSASHGLAVDIPAAIPEVTGVGGTEFSGDAGVCANNTCTGNTAPADNPYWSGSNSPTSGASALQYIPEVTWNDTNSSQISSGGGGASTVFGKPSWQTGTGVPGDGKRDVPDVSLSGSNGHDPYLICSQDFFSGVASPPTSCTTGFRASDQTLAAIGGTSAGAPTFAGIVALLNQATGSNGLGNVNPMLYGLFANNAATNVFHDVTSGTNKVPCTSGTTNCPAGTTSIGFSAGAGYDQVTGLGSLNVTKLVNAWLAASPTADFYLDGLVSKTSAGQAGTSTVTVTALNGFTGTVDLTCTPSNAAVHISCTLTPTSVDLSSNQTGTAQLSIATVAGLNSPSGSHSRGLWFVASGGLFAVVSLGGLPSRSRWLTLSSLIIVGALITAVGCGGGSSSSQKRQSQGTPAGTYSITVMGTSGALSHSATVSLTVQ
jgi:subtilase family serine protease